MRRRLIFPLAGMAGAALAVLAGIALAKSFTLVIAHNAKVTNQSHTTKTESIVTNGGGMAVYWLTGDSASHPECTSACMQFWPPVKAGKAKSSAESGIKGKLGTWKHDGFAQVTLGGHPLYTFSLDKSKRDATGEGVMSFGGTWHVVRPSGISGSHSQSTTTSTNTMSTSTTSSTYSYGTTTAASTTGSATTSTPCVGYYC